LHLASVLGSTFAVIDLVHAFGTPAPALVRVLRPALLDGVVVQRGAQLAFRHPLVRDAVYGDIPVSTREALHLHAGRALAGAGAPRPGGSSGSRSRTPASCSAAAPSRRSRARSWLRGTTWTAGPGRWRWATRRWHAS